MLTLIKKKAEVTLLISAEQTTEQGRVSRVINRSIKGESVSHSVVSDCAAPWTIAPQTPLSVELSRQE